MVSKSETAPGIQAGRPDCDWEAVELAYRAGVKTLRQIAAEHGITHGAINKRARKHGWVRDLSAKINAKADALVSKALVSKLVSRESRAVEQQVIDAGAQAVADVRLAHRRDIHRARSLTNALLDELEKSTDPKTLELLSELGEFMRSPDDKGVDKLNDLYQAVISLPERSKTLRMLGETLQRLVDMERIAFGIDDKGAKNANPFGADRSLSDTERAVRLVALLRMEPDALRAITEPADG